MKKNDFIKKYGKEPQTVAPNFVGKTVSKNYQVETSIIEFIDNAYDAKVKGQDLTVEIKSDEVNHRLTIVDNGSGISDESKLFMLGGTDKERAIDKIGKYGIGACGATVALALNCVFDKNSIVDVTYESACNGKLFVKHVGVNPSDETPYYGTAIFKDCDSTKHYTKIVFDNVTFKSQIAKVVDTIEETFEETLQSNLSVVVNGRQLGKTMKHTFVGDEIPIHVNVGDFPTYLKYRVIGGEGKEDRKFEETGLRVYDKNSHRLLAKDTKLWKYFAGKEAQQAICGLRCGIYIDSSLDCYNMFGIKPQKNGIEYKLYYNKPEFKELKDELDKIYRKQSYNSATRLEDKTIEIDGVSITTAPLDKGVFYTKIGKKSIIVKEKLTKKDILSIIIENVNLHEKCERLTHKSYKK